MDARTGEVLWRCPLGASVRNSIAIEGRKVLAQDVHGQLVCRRCGNGNGKLEKGSGDRRCASAQRRACGFAGSGISRHGQDAVGILHRQPSVNGRNQSACGKRHCLRGCLGRRNLCSGCSQGDTLVKTCDRGARVRVDGCFGQLPVCGRLFGKRVWICL